MMMMYFMKSSVALFARSCQSTQDGLRPRAVGVPDVDCGQSRAREQLPLNLVEMPMCSTLTVRVDVLIKVVSKKERSFFFN
jgi:hypothetical protein